MFWLGIIGVEGYKLREVELKGSNLIVSLQIVLNSTLTPVVKAIIELFSPTFPSFMHSK